MKHNLLALLGLFSLAAFSSPKVTCIGDLIIGTVKYSIGHGFDSADYSGRNNANIWVAHSGCYNEMALGRIEFKNTQTYVDSHTLDTILCDLELKSLQIIEQASEQVIVSKDGKTYSVPFSCS